MAVHSLAIAALGVAVACGRRESLSTTDTFPPLHAVTPANFDTSCAACKDFYTRVNGGWIARTEIPAIYTSVGVDRDVADRTEALLHTILDEARTAAPSTNDPNTRLVGLYYGSCMDTARADALGVAPLATELAKIQRTNDPLTLAAALADQQLIGSAALFTFGPEQDFKNSAHEIPALYQGGIGLPDRDFYLLPDSASHHIRNEYVKHIVRMMRLLGADSASAAADAGTVMTIETTLAQVSMSRTEARDPQHVYHMMSMAQLEQLAPHFAWPAYFTAMSMPAADSLNVGMPHFVRAMDSLLVSIPMDDWKVYLRWHLASTTARLLGTPFVQENFAVTQLLTGAKELKPRWKRCLDATDGAIGEALGREYVKRAFTPDAKARALRMVQGLEAAFHDRIEAVDWMSDATKQQAIAKLNAITNKIGYPDHWRDYSALTLSDTVYAANGMAADAFETHRQLNKIGKPVDRAEWQMTPPTDNAYYDPSNNEIVFPAGILQPPYFDPAADDASNFGGIGAVIGHEMTHGFDDEGRKFDGAGNMHEWWTPKDVLEFEKRTNVVVEEYGAFLAVDTMHINGKLTLGENIADIGGIKIAWDAFQRATQGKPRETIGGFTPEQRFFISYAESWRIKLRPESERTRGISDPHSPARWRVDGVVANMPEFAAAFGCTQGDPMVRPAHLLVRIW